MTETKFTPGPWMVGSHDRNGQRIVEADIEICTCWHHSCGSIEKMMEANANLIAAAPDLYAALDLLPLDAFDRDPADLDAAEFVDHAGEFMAAMAAARAALAKARGAA